MNEAKWTDAPWVANPHVDAGDGQDVVSARNGLAICRCGKQSIYRKGGAYTTTKAQRRANAHLIAAAPELYEALSMMAVICPAETEHERECVKKARAALAKARGETS